jgi:hypothetical protein
MRLPAPRFVSRKWSPYMRGTMENRHVASLIRTSTCQNEHVPARIRPSLTASASMKVGTDADTVV